MIPNRKATLQKRRSIWQGAGSSQGMVEFALALPVLLMILFAIIDFSLLFSAWLEIQNMSRQAVRYAVTTAWDQSYCQAGCTTVADQDQARIKSIKDVAMDYRAGMVIDGNAGQSQPGYLKVLICSNKDWTGPQGLPDKKPDIQPVAGKMGSNIYSQCNNLTTSPSTPMEDPGEGGDTVSVMVDFNNPFITPFLQLLNVFTPSNSPSWNWKMTHLVSVQSGVVEKFRTSDYLPTVPGIGRSTYTPTYTPSITDTPTPTNTFTITDTPTNTSSPTTTDTPTHTSSPTTTGTSTFTPTRTYTGTSTFTRTNSPTPTSLYTNTQTYTPTITFTPTRTFTPTQTFTSTLTFTITQTSTLR